MILDLKGKLVDVVLDVFVDLFLDIECFDEKKGLLVEFDEVLEVFCVFGYVECEVFCVVLELLKELLMTD